MEFIISETDDILVSHAGLALAGALLRRTDLRSRLDALAVQGLKRPVAGHSNYLLRSGHTLDGFPLDGNTGLNGADQPGPDGGECCFTKLPLQMSWTACSWPGMTY